MIWYLSWVLKNEYNLLGDKKKKDSLDRRNNYMWRYVISENLKLLEYKIFKKGLSGGEVGMLVWSEMMSVFVYYVKGI